MEKCGSQKICEQMPVSDSEEDCMKPEENQRKMDRGAKAKTKRKSKSSPRKLGRKKKKLENLDTEDESDNDPGKNAMSRETAVTFQEEDNVIEMQVLDQSEFPSDEENDNEGDEGEQQEVYSSEEEG